MSSRKVVLASDGFYYRRSETTVAGGIVLALPGAVPRDSFGRTLDEPTIDDAVLAQMPLSSPGPTSSRP